MFIRTMVFLLLLIGSNTGWSQQQLITFERLTNQVELPFSYVNDFIVVEVVLDHLFPLQFIFDTGAENTILTRKEYTDILRANYQRKVSIYGADLKTELTGYIAAGVDLRIGENLVLWSQSLLVMEEDYFRFEEYTGTEIHGILGADILRRFTVSIDFRRKKIIIQDPSTFSPPRKANFFELNTEFSRYKPYWEIPASLIAGQTTSFKLLMDTGASLPLMLYTSTDTTLNMPKNLIRTNIGHGLGGVIEGFIGRTAYLQIGEYRLGNVLTRFQDISKLQQVDSTFLNNRNGIVGNVILSRFSIIIDYVRERVYLRPNKNFKKEFTFDRSGLSLIASGELLNSINVLNVVAGSPADEAGIRKGDRIRKVNGVPAGIMGLAGIVARFRKKVGKKYKVIIERDGEKRTVRFVLRDLI